MISEKRGKEERNDKGMDVSLRECERDGKKKNK
jgi:hypothetical protein